MDAIDFSICMSLVVNSRISYRQLAEKFNMSVNSIHKRVKKLVKLGLITKFKTQISGIFFNLTNVVMFGSSKSKDLEGLLQKLGNHENIYNVTQASGNFMYMHAHIRNLNELDSLTSFVRKVGEIDEPTVGLMPGFPAGAAPSIDSSGDFGDRSISKLDFLIINALKDNSRKPIPKVAEEVGASTKTVRRRLNQLIEKNLVQFTIDWYPDKSNDIMSIMILKLNPSLNIDKMKLMETFYKQHGRNVAFVWIFSNLPNLILVCSRTNSMKELQKLESSIKSEKFESIIVTVLFKGENFPTWEDKFLEEKIKEINVNSN